MRGFGAAGVALSLCLVAGCTGQDPPPSDPTLTTPQQSSANAPSTAVPTAPTTSVPPGAPVLLDDARQQTPEGAEAFVRHWFETLEYSWEVMDSAPIRQLGECASCLQYAQSIDAVAARGNSIAGGTVSLASLAGSAVLSDGSSTVLVTFGAEEQTEVSQAGDVVAVIGDVVVNLQFLFNVSWQEGWRIAAIRTVS